MGHIPNTDLLEALKLSLRELDNTKLLSPNDLEVFDLRRNLREQIGALERHLAQVQAHGMPLR